jgi:hypothetical protein
MHKGLSSNPESPEKKKKKNRIDIWCREAFVIQKNKSDKCWRKQENFHSMGDAKQG